MRRGLRWQNSSCIQELPKHRALLSTLAPDAISEVMAQAKLGEARSCSMPAGPRRLTQSLSPWWRPRISGPQSTVPRAQDWERRLAQMGELRDALDIWRGLLLSRALAMIEHSWSCWSPMVCCRAASGRKE